jgi:hypothetical protein
MQTKTFIAIAACLTLVVVSATVMAQGPGGPPGPPGGTSGPIDGGAFALLIGAIAYGYKSLKAADTDAGKEE